MAKFGGGFGGGMNMQNLMKQAKAMQEKMEQAQNELEECELEGTSGSGMVKVTVNGKKKLLSVKLDPKIVDSDDVELLEDLIVAAFNEASDLADEKSAELMGPLGGSGLF